MSRRMELQALLTTLMEPYAQYGLSCVFYQPPATIKMPYPCIVYRLDNIDTDFADNNPYKHMDRYLLTLIDKDPDSKIVDSIKMLPACTFDRYYSADNLHHFAFRMYY